MKLLVPAVIADFLLGNPELGIGEILHVFLPRL